MEVYVPGVSTIVAGSDKDGAVFIVSKYRITPMRIRYMTGLRSFISLGFNFKMQGDMCVNYPKAFLKTKGNFKGKNYLPFKIFDSD
jgi:hypothetical protein